MLTNYLMKAERGAVNSKDDVVYFMTVIDVQSHTHPLYITRCINEKMKELGLYKTHYSSMISAWKGDIEDSITYCEKQVAAYENHKKDFPMMYHGPLQALAALNEAKRVVKEEKILN